MGRGAVPSPSQRRCIVPETMSRQLPVVNPAPRDPSLTPDCEHCCGLCCVAPGFLASPDFAIDKPAGHPCPNLTADFRCGIHDRLRGEGFRGCVAYDCFGAGQNVTQHTFKGQDWRGSPDVAARMFEVFGIMRQVHALRLYLGQGLELQQAQPLWGEVQAKRAELEGYSRANADTLLQMDIARHKAEVNQILLRVSALVRAPNR